MSSYGFWLSAAGMKVQQHRQSILANNLANASTTGFKRDLAVVLSRQVESQESPSGFKFAHPVLQGLGGGVDVRPTYQDHAQGNIEATNQPLDVAIKGEGYFQVSDGTETRYTRDGEFVLNANGELALAAGDGKWKVLSDGGAPIAIGDEGGEVGISKDGSILQGDTVLAKIGIVTTDDKQALRKVGENLFKVVGVEMEPVNSELATKSRETSNYDVMIGLARMIEASRAYQLNATMIQLQDQVTGQAANTVGRVA